jgi:hypothetical protein
VRGRAVLVTLAVLALLIVVGVSLRTPTGTTTASPSPIPTATAAVSPSPTATPIQAAATTPTPPAAASPAAACRNDYLPGETPIVAPRKSGRFAEVALDAVKVGPGVFGTTTRWLVRAFDPTGSPGTFELPLRATVRTGAGAELTVVGYEAGPPNAGSERVTETVVIHPCDPAAIPGSPQRGKVVLIVHTAPISSGAYTLTLRDLKLPEGGTREESWPVTLRCSPSPEIPGGLECR